jgi:hypothetical protein
MNIIYQSVGVEDTASLYRAASSDRKKYDIFPPDWGLDTYNKYGELFANDGLHRASASVYEDAVNYVERKDLADSKPHKRCAKQLVKCGKYGEAMDMLAAGDFHYRGAAGRASPMHIAERPVVGTYTKLIKEECTLEEFEEGVNAIVDDHRYNSEKNSPGPDPDNFYKLEGEFLNYLIQKNKKQRAIQLAREIIEREYSWKGWKGTCPIKDCDESISLDELACHVQSVHY